MSSDRRTLTAEQASSYSLDLALRFCERTFVYEWLHISRPLGKLGTIPYFRKTSLRIDYGHGDIRGNWWQGFENVDYQNLIYERCGVPTIKIFMDDLHLCPNCDRCWPVRFRRQFFNQLPEWLEWEPQKIRELALSRLDTKEIYLALCPSRGACARYRSSRIKPFQDETLMFDSPPTQPTFQASKTVAAADAAREAITNFVYLLRQEKFIKIGIARKPEVRLSALRIGSPFQITLLKTWRCKPARQVEVALHRKFRNFRKKGEWFDLPDAVIEELLRVECIEDFVFRKTNE